MCRTGNLNFVACDVLFHTWLGEELGACEVALEPW
jgi:hypothetical protein